MTVGKNPTTILLVEPREDSYQLIRGLFSENMPGLYEVFRAPDYDTTVSMVQDRGFDVCLAPSRIGEHDVTDLLSEISRNGWKIPVMVLTGNAGSIINPFGTVEAKGSHSHAEGGFWGNFLEQHIRFAMERDRVESAVMRAKKEWETIFDAIPDPIALIDRNYECRRANRAMADRLGASPADLIGRKCYEVVHGLSAPPDFCPMSKVLQDGCEHSAEIFEKNLDGIFLISVSPFFDDENNFVYGIHVARDITGLKKIEEELRESNENLEQHVAMRTLELVQKAKDIEESNTALRVLLKHREQDKTEIQESVTHNIMELVFPHLDRMEYGNLSKEQLNAAVREIKSALKNVISPFPRSLSGWGLSPAEIRIAAMVRAGKSNKEIAEVLSISDGTVRTHRERIRKKLQLTNRKTNLQAYLDTLQ